MNTDYIEVICSNMMCFRVNAKTLEPLGISYYEPAAWNDPRSKQMSLGKWTGLYMLRLEAQEGFVSVLPTTKRKAHKVPKGI